MSAVPPPASVSRSARTRQSGHVVLERLPSLDGGRPLDVAERFRDLPGLALLESARPGRAGRWSYLAAAPVEVVGAGEGADPFGPARASLARLARGAVPAAPGSEQAHATEPGQGVGPAYRREPAHGTAHQVTVPPFLGGLVGYLGYDLGRRFERLPSIALADQDLPDLRLGCYPWVIAWDGRTGAAWLGGRAVDGDTTDLARRLDVVLARLDARVPDAAPAAAAPAFAIALDTDRAAWTAGVEAVRAAIAAGELYQANLTRRLTARFDDDPWPLFRLLRTGEPAAFSAYLDLGRAVGSGGRPRGGPRAILSASPEPFLALDPDGHVRTDPIKGTRPRGRTPEQDRAFAAELIGSTKDRAENTMIVDVLRNDLGRVCVPGSVRVPRLWRLERTPSVQHLVSSVTGALAPGRDAFDLLRACFPGGSITGAPKIRAMELVEGLEPVRRGPYTGALGWIGPDGAMGTSILIRTFVADGSRLTLHVGGGITYRSDPDEEWEETVTKARGPLAAIGARVADR